MRLSLQALDGLCCSAMSFALRRRDLLGLLATGPSSLVLAACAADDPERYTEADRAKLAAQREREATDSGQGRFGSQRYRGYRGLAELPWFDLDSSGTLRLTAADLPLAIDMHCHFGISALLAPEIDLQARSPRVRHLLDCDAENPGCDLDLDIYINGNFTPEDLRSLQLGTMAQILWGSAAAETQTIPNLLAEMEASGVGQAMILPIALGLPFGDDLTERWMAAIRLAGAGDRFVLGGSVHPRDPDRVAKLETHAAAGARMIKLHPTVQRFYPDDAAMMDVYQACERLGLAVFFHAGRAGIEPEVTHRYALPRHYEGPLRSFPGVDFVLGHSGARDFEGMLEIGARYENAWFGIHGQGVSRLDELIRKTGGERLLFGTDWPFYHLAATLAKVLIVTEGQDDLRRAILRGNAEALLGLA